MLICSEEKFDNEYKTLGSEEKKCTRVDNQWRVLKDEVENT